jgi:XRE family transcriptional regulator, regulator of sulfur utilization
MSDEGLAIELPIKELPMFTRRDALVALVAVGSVFNVKRLFAQTDAKVMGSSAFDWTTLPVQQTKVGSTRKVCQAPTATLDELECHITTLNPGETPHPPHKHADEEIVIIREGTCEFTMNGETHRVGPGSVIFQASNQLHSVRNVGDTPATYHVIKWNSPGMLKKKTA